MTWLDIAWVVLNRHQQKRPAQAHQPEVYLEPKWLRCKVLSKKPLGMVAKPLHPLLVPAGQ